MTPRVRAWIAALPDATTAVAFGLAWVVPNTVGLPFVRTMFVTFLLEFLAVHAGGMLAGAAETKPRKQTGPRYALPLALGGFVLLYLAFAAGFCVAFGTWWTFGAFALVMVAKVVPLMTRGSGGSVQNVQQVWAASVLWYLGSVFATLFIPLPDLGLDPATQSALDLPGSGEWVDAPEKPLAAGVIYFTLMAWTRGVTAKQ